MSTPNSLHCIVPPHMLESIERNGTVAQQEWASATLAADVVAREERAAQAAVIRDQPVQPAVGPPRKDRSIHDGGNGATLPGRRVRGEGAAPTGDGDVDRVYDGFGATWDLYFDVFGRNSFDNAGASLVGTVHHRRRYNNAFWNGTQMAFGDGDGTLFVSFTTAVDVMGHELTHAVTERSSGLEYHDQPGALNESLSDVFGSLVKQRGAAQSATAADWLIGAGILGPTINGVALRSMKAPGTAYDDPTLGRDPQPAHMDDYDPTPDDNGGVHINSGIPNHAFYLFAVALGGNAWEQAGQVWYATATDPALSSSASFQEFAELTVSHAQDLYDTEVAGSCSDAWAGVGIVVPLR
ncbi:M4 family metallopeptidase [Nocardioides sp.]|uniref:M4 family metallopeptidase n=1 Tax=Nocardioides sp. TaxID=35761 RepID=UPI003D136769